MHQHYRDIMEPINASPTWFDEVGVPRYCAFSPSHLNNIYAYEAALAEIKCQNCGAMFHVALTGAFAARGRSLGDEIRLHRVHYGDPPNVDCCGSGAAMNSEMQRIVEYWSRVDSIGWVRDGSNEGPIFETRLDPPDTEGAARTALANGATRILVMCSSRPSQYHAGGSMVGELAKPQPPRLLQNVLRRLRAKEPQCRLLVLCEVEYSIIARKMALSAMSESEVGYSKSDLPAVVAEFAEIGNLQSVPSRIVVLSGTARPIERARSARDAGREWLMDCGATTIVEFALREEDIVLRNAEITIEGRLPALAERP